MTNHFISFPLKKKKKKKRRNYIEDTRTKTPSPSPRHSTPQHPPPNVINHPKKRKRPRAYLPLEKFGTRKWREAALPAARRHFEERVAMGGGGGGGHTRMSNVRCADVTRVWMRCGARRSTVSVPVISPRCTGRGSRAEDRWHCFLCPSRGWDEDEQKLVGEEREGRDRQRPVGNGASRWYLRGRGSNLYNESF